MRILITGGCGYIGSVAVEEFLQDGYDVTVLDNLLYRQTSLLQHCHHHNFHFVHGDVRNKQILVKLMDKADVILPLAAIVGAPACDRDKQAATDVNLLHIKTIIDHKSKNQLVVYPNTNSAYGDGQGAIYCTEETLIRPISHYGKTKCDAERMVLDTDGVSLRLATVFGCSPRMRNDLLVNNFVYEAMDKGYVVLFEKDFKRNYVHVRDVVAAFRLMVSKFPKGGDLFNVGLSDANLSKWELCLKIKEHVPHFSIQVDEFSTDKDKRNYLVSNAKIESYGWKPHHSLDAGIRELIMGFQMLFAKNQTFTNL